MFCVPAFNECDSERREIVMAVLEKKVSYDIIKL